MLPSPSSSLSSFRDYYLNNSSQDETLLTEQDRLVNGYRNFYISKIFTIIAKKLENQKFWIVLKAFIKIKKLDRLKSKSQRKKNEAFASLIKSMNNRTSQLSIKSIYLGKMLDNIEKERERQIKKGLYFGTQYIKSKYLQFNDSFYRLQSFSKLKKSNDKQLSNGVEKYIKKLKKAVLALVIRNLINQKIGRSFSLICKNQRQILEKSNQKKDKEIKGKRKILAAYKISMCVLKKMVRLSSHFMTKIKLIKRSFEDMKDNPQIYCHIFKHVLYLSSKYSKKALKTTYEKGDRVNPFAFSRLLKRISRRQKKIKEEIILRWRKVNNDYNLSLRKQIERLQQLKLNYMNQN